MNLEKFKARLEELNSHRKMFEMQLSTLAGHIAEVTYIISQIENPQPEPVPVPEPVENPDGQANQQAA